MRHIAVCTAAILVTVALSGLGAESLGTLTVRLYNSSHLVTAEMLRARRVAEPILRDAGMDVTIRLCGGQPGPDAVVDPCNDRLEPSEVVVRAIDSPRYSLTLHPRVFGVAYLVTGTNQGRLATLYSDRIAGAAARVNLEPGTLMGRVLAHEVGHLLLGTREHSETGLMRADWSDELLHRDAADEWRFSMVEAAAMQNALAINLLE